MSDIGTAVTLWLLKEIFSKPQPRVTIHTEVPTPQAPPQLPPARPRFKRGVSKYKQGMARPKVRAAPSATAVPWPGMSKVVPRKPSALPPKAGRVKIPGGGTRITPPTVVMPKYSTARAEKEVRMVPMPRPGAEEIAEAKRQLASWSDGRRVNKGTGESYRQYRHTRHGDKKAVEVWVRSNQKVAQEKRVVRRIPSSETTYPPTIRRGSRGDTVKLWQRLLTSNGFEGIADDGIFGPLTESATKRYQAKNGLTVDGIVGPQTWGHALRR